MGGAVFTVQADGNLAENSVARSAPANPAPIRRI